jgi:hypothetical protein
VRHGAALLVVAAALGTAGFATAAVASSRGASGLLSLLGSTNRSPAAAAQTVPTTVPACSSYDVSEGNASALQSAVGQATANAVICVGPGTYDLHALVGAAGGSASLDITQPGVQLVGAGLGVTEIDLDGLRIDASNVLVAGFSFVGPGTWDAGTHTVTGGSTVVSFGSGVTESAFAENAVSGGNRGVALGEPPVGSTSPDNCYVVGNELFHNNIAVFGDGGSGNGIGGNHIHDNGSDSAAILLQDSAQHFAGEASSDSGVAGNTIESSGYHGISIRVSGVSVVGNTIDNSGIGVSQGASGIEVLGAPGAPVGGTTIVSNTITGSPYAAIKIGGYVDSTSIEFNVIGPNDGIGVVVLGGDYNPDGNAANENKIVGNAGGGVENDDPATPSFDATSNWWGDASGPSGQGSGSGDSVGPNVAFDPWLDSDPTTTTVPTTTGTTTGTTSTTGTTTTGTTTGTTSTTGTTTTGTTSTTGTTTTGTTSTTETTTTGTTSTTGTTTTGTTSTTGTTTTGTTSTTGTTTTGTTSTTGTTTTGTTSTTGTTTTGTTSTTGTTATGTTGTTATGTPASTTTTAGGVPDVVVSMSAPASGSVGTDVTFVATVRNVGTAPATGVTFAMSVPTGATFVSASTSQGSCSGTVSCNLGTLAAGASANVTVVLRAEQTGTLAVSASVSADRDSNSGNNSSSASTPVVAQAGAPPPPSQPGTFNAVSTGTVLVNGVPETADLLFPLKSGDVVDVTNGVVTFTTSDGSVGIFSGSELTPMRRTSARGSLLASPVPAVFSVDQPASSGSLTTLTLVSGDFSVCTTPRRLQAPNKTVVRRLWGKAKGKFRTKARFGAATIRGTVWLTEDRCDGSLVTSVADVVDVLDLSLNKSVALNPGESYLAAPPQSFKPPRARSRTQTAATVRKSGLRWGGRHFGNRAVFSKWLAAKGSSWHRFSTHHPKLAKALASRR